MKNFLIFILLVTGIKSSSQLKIFTSDIDNFWVAYDSIRKTGDHSKQLAIINELYIDKGTKGLHAFMKSRNFTDSLYVELINDFPLFWNSVRKNTLSIKDRKEELSAAVANLQRLYPDLKEAEIYFTIGGLTTGGTITDHSVLIGSEIAAGDKTVDVSEFQNNWLQQVFEHQSADNFVFLNIHEYVHTQQTGSRKKVLNHSLREGTCDFIAELALGTRKQTYYQKYGLAHEADIKADFKRDMFTDRLSNWLYNGNRKKEGSDLGYFMGYVIAKAYYQQAADKVAAVKEIIELNFADDTAVEQFLERSKYYKETINKKALLADYRMKQPYVKSIAPFGNNAVDVDPATKELRIIFSKEMTGNMSINYSEKGKDYFPITAAKGFENGGTTLVLQMNLQPGKEYELIITDKSFLSKDGYPLRTESYPVQFTTRK